LTCASPSFLAVSEESSSSPARIAEIETLLDEVDASIGEHDLDAHLGVAAEESSDDGSQEAAAVEHRLRHPQQARRRRLPLLHLAVGFVDLRRDG
jgi:hypothetical protein